MKLSVHMITYNHENFIRKAIESVLMQRTNFDYELVIGDDKSTDNTREIILEYYEKYPNIIKLNFPEKNVGTINNFKSTLKMCKGEYIAILEGDDFWIDENKLQKQVDFLDNNKEYSMCFTNYNELEDITGSLNYKSILEICKKFDTENLIKLNFIPHLTCVFRNKDFDTYPEWLWDCKILDYPMHLIRSIDGRLGYIDEITSVYRKHGSGMTSKSNEIWWHMELIKIMSNFNMYTSYKYDKEIQRNIAINNSYIMVNETNKDNALKIYKKIIFKGFTSRTILRNKIKFLKKYLRGKYE